MTDINKLKEAMVLAAAPLEAMIAGGSVNLHSEEVREAIHVGVNAVREALSYKHSDAREDCPWKCKTGDAKCLCSNRTQNTLVCAEHGLTPDPECMVCHLNPTKTP